MYSLNIQAVFLMEIINLQQPGQLRLDCSCLEAIYNVALKNNGVGFSAHRERLVFADSPTW